MKNIDVQWVIGNENMEIVPLMPYSDIIIEFLDDFSRELRKNIDKIKYSDLMSLAFWCRKGNISKLKEVSSDFSKSLGRGLIFHITPSNVPVNFAFSYFFGLLSGNANIVRLPSKDYPQIEIICNTIKKIFENDKYSIIKNGTAFIKYGHNKEITDMFSSMADGRIIWGGDNTINEIRQSSMKPKSTEIVFADRYSIGIIDTEEMAKASEEEINQLADKFYNDTYLMDQNVCSTPHIIFWRGNTSEEVKEKFWKAVFESALKYDLEPIKAMDKYTDICMFIMSGKFDISNVKKYENLLYTIELKKLPEDISELRGRFGMFLQYNFEDLKELEPFISEKIQTLLYYGIDKQELLNYVLDNHLKGIDRIVPFGQSLDIGVFWDGYDIVGQLSRKIFC